MFPQASIVIWKVNKIQLLLDRFADPIINVEIKKIFLI